MFKDETGKRKIQIKLDDFQEDNENLQQEITELKNKIKRCNDSKNTQNETYLDISLISKINKSIIFTQNC